MHLTARVGMKLAVGTVDPNGRHPGTVLCMIRTEHFKVLFPLMIHHDKVGWFVKQLGIERPKDESDKLLGFCKKRKCDKRDPGASNIIGIDGSIHIRNSRRTLSSI